MRVINLISDSANTSTSIHHVHRNIDYQLRLAGMEVESLLLAGEHRDFGPSLDRNFDVLRRPRKHPLRYRLLRRKLKKILRSRPYTWVIADGLLSANVVMDIQHSLPASIRFLLVIHGRVKILKPKLPALQRTLQQGWPGRWRLVAVSRDSAQFLQQQLSMASVPVSVVENCIDGLAIRDSLLDRPTAARMLGLDPEMLVFGAIGRLSAEKHFHILIRSFAKLNGDARLLLIGDGRERENLEAEAARTGISDRIVFAGYKENARQYLAVIDCFVMTSRTEGSPIALLEALAAERPVICSDIPPLVEVLPEGYPYIFGVDEVDQLADSMAAFMKLGAAERLKLGNELGREADQRFSPEVFGRLYREILQE